MLSRCAFQVRNHRALSKCFAVRLERYFAAFYSREDYLLAASADALLRMTADGKVLWKTRGLGLDGVTINRVGNGCVEDQGEWDPPGGWRPFKLQLESGKVVAAGLPSPISIFPAAEVELDPTVAAAHAQLANLDFTSEWNWPKAESARAWTKFVVVTRWSGLFYDEFPKRRRRC